MLHLFNYVESIDDTHFFHLPAGNLMIDHQMVISFDKEDGVDIYPINIPGKTVNSDYFHEEVDGNLHFNMHVTNTSGVSVDLEASITPNEPGIDILGLQDWNF